MADDASQRESVPLVGPQQNSAEFAGRPPVEAALQFARVIPYWFLAIIGLIYASGFLVVTTHLERYGVRDVGTDVWKSRYIHMGVLSVVFPVMIVGTFYGLWYTYLLRKKEPAVRGLAFQSVISGLVFLMLELALYGFVILARQNSSIAVIWDLLEMMLIAFLGLILATVIERRSAERWVLLGTAALRLGVLVAVVWLFVRAFATFWDLIVELLQGRSPALLLMICFLLLIGYTLFNLKLREADFPQARRQVAWILITCIVGPMYFLSLMGFAFSLFAYIPATRDGGDYTTSPLVTISLRTGTVLPRARLVEETSAALYIADESDDPLQWRKDPLSAPKTLRAIGRDQIALIEYIPSTISPNGAVPHKP